MTIDLSELGDVDDYIADCRPEVRAWLEAQRDRIESAACGGAHPAKQKRSPGGLKRHLLQTIEKALELNQLHSEVDIIETLLVHDLRRPETAPLKDYQLLAIAATKGTPYEVWRKSPEFRFVALILVVDMWSAFVNVEDRER
jgi:hypothetical protein